MVHGMRPQCELEPRSALYWARRGSMVEDGVMRRDAGDEAAGQQQQRQRQHEAFPQHCHPRRRLPPKTERTGHQRPKAVRAGHRHRHRLPPKAQRACGAVVS